VTGPGQPALPPGWYPDPDGAPGMVRWWDGGTWSDVATPAGPGVAVQSSPVLTRTAPAHPHVEVIEAPAAVGGGGRSGLVALISLVALVAVVGVALFMGSSGGDGTEAESTATPSSGAPAGPTFPPGTVRIVDEESGISYPFMGDGWYEFDLFPQEEVTAIAGQYFTTQELTPDGTTFIAQCTSGPLADGYGWGGASTLESTMAAVADSVRANYYPGPNERKVLRQEQREVDGHAAYLYEFQLSWDVPGYDASGERAALLLIDVGRPAPALMYISIPNTHAELYGAIDRLVEAVDVL